MLETVILGLRERFEVFRGLIRVDVDFEHFCFVVWIEILEIVFSEVIFSNYVTQS